MTAQDADSDNWVHSPKQIIITTSSPRLRDAVEEATERE